MIYASIYFTILYKDGQKLEKTRKYRKPMPHNQGVTGSSPVGTTKVSDLCRSPFLIYNIGNSSMKFILTILGFIALGLGVLGAFVPVLPTTPFLLLSAALFLRSNKKLYEWLLNHHRLGTYISNFMVHKAIPLRVKVVSISVLWITLLYCAVFISQHWALRVLFIAIAIGVTIHILSYKTLK